MKKKSEFLSENFAFVVVKFSIDLNRRVFVMEQNPLQTGLGVDKSKQEVTKVACIVQSDRKSTKRR